MKRINTMSSYMYAMIVVILLLCNNNSYKWTELASSYKIGGSNYGDNTPQTFTHSIDNNLYLRPIPQGEINAFDMTADEKAAYQNPGYQ